MREWLDRLRGHETDAAFLVTPERGVHGHDAARRSAVRRAGPDADAGAGPGHAEPHARARAAPAGRRADRSAAGRAGPISRCGRERTAAHVSDVPRRDAERLIDLARERHGDAQARPLFVRRGRPARRAHGRLRRRARVRAVTACARTSACCSTRSTASSCCATACPIGYALASALWRSSEIAFNMFDTYRGGEAGWVYGRVLAVMRSALRRSTRSRSTPTSSGTRTTKDSSRARGGSTTRWVSGPGTRRRPRWPIAKRSAWRAAWYRTPAATLRKLVRANLFLHLDARAAGRHRPDSDGSDRVARDGFAGVTSGFGP